MIDLEKALSDVRAQEKAKADSDAQALSQRLANAGRVHREVTAFKDKYSYDLMVEIDGPRVSLYKRGGEALEIVAIERDRFNTTTMARGESEQDGGKQGPLDGEAVSRLIVRWLAPA